MGHTPGPWTMCTYTGHEEQAAKNRAWNGAIVSAHGDVIAGPFSFWAMRGKTATQAEANAHLIALAPSAPHRCDDALCSGNRLYALLLSVRDDVKGVLGSEARVLLAKIDAVQPPTD